MITPTFAGYGIRVNQAQLCNLFVKHFIIRAESRTPQQFLTAQRKSKANPQKLYYILSTHAAFYLVAGIGYGNLLSALCAVATPRRKLRLTHSTVRIQGGITLRQADYGLLVYPLNALIDGKQQCSRQVKGDVTIKPLGVDDFLITFPDLIAKVQGSGSRTFGTPSNFQDYTLGHISSTGKLDKPRMHLIA